MSNESGSVPRGRLRALAFSAVTALVAALAVALPAGTANAATTYTWTQGWAGNGDPVPGADHKSWSDPENWSPQGVPGAGDTVVLGNAPGQAATTLTVPSGTSLQSFTMTSADQRTGNVYLEGAPLTVAGSFDWTGGHIGIPVTVAGEGRLGPGTVKYLEARGAGHGMLTVTGTLHLDDIGASDDARLSMAPDTGGDADGIRIAPGGALLASGTNLIAGTGCCTDPAKVVIDGDLAVSGGATTVKAVELTLHGSTSVARGAVLAGNTGPVRLGDGARYAGGGTIDFTQTASIRANPDREPVPGGILMEGTGQLAGGTTIHLGIGAKLTGVGGFGGAGTIDVSAAANTGQDGAHLYGDLTLGKATLLRLGGAVPSRLEVRDPDLSGYHGVLRVGGAAELATGSTFVTQGGTSTTVARGGSLQLQPGATWGDGNCCSQPARLTVQKGGTLETASGSGADPRVTRVDLRARGTVSLAAGRKLVTVGHPVTLGGTLHVTGTTPVGRQRTVLTAERVQGRFGCVDPGGQTATYSATAVRLTGVVGSFSGCTSPTSTKLASRKLAGHKTLKVKATKGVAAKAKKVLVAVTVAKVSRPAKVKVGGAPAFKAARGRTVRYLVAKRNAAKQVTVQNKGTKPVKITVVLLGAVR